MKSHAASASRLGQSLRFKTIALDNLCQQVGLVPDLIKVDVEGAENDVLAGSRHLVQSRKTRFLVEMHSSVQLPMSTNVQHVLEWCSATQYSAWYLKQHVQLRDPATVSTRGRCHLLLQPKEWEFPAWLTSVAQGAAIGETVT